MDHNLTHLPLGQSKCTYFTQLQVVCHTNISIADIHLLVRLRIENVDRKYARRLEAPASRHR